MNQNITDIFELDSHYSTTRRVRQTTVDIIAAELKAAHKPEDTFETLVFLPEGESRKGEGGLRTQGYFKQSTEDKPLITVVTVVFNGEQFLEETILSVINQTYDNVEYIIIDGGSTDCTLDIIKKYEHAIDYWVSEKDKGIYDAMNKGIDIATGEWINFMNGGDKFSTGVVLSDIFLGKEYNETIMFGDVIADYGSFQKEIKAKTNLSKLWQGMCFSHQSTFFSTDYHKKNKYNIDFKLAADFDVIYKAYINKKKFAYLGKSISTIEVGGVSYINREKVFSEYRKVSCAVNIGFMCFYFVHSIFLFKVKKIVKFFIGDALAFLLIRLKT